MSGDVKPTKALPFPQNWHMTEGAHFNGGKEWFGYRMNCIEQPRLSRFDRYTRKDRSVASTWEVDGVGCADADAAWLALQTPPEVTAEERAALALIGDEPADMRQVIPYEMRHSLSAKGLIEYGPPGRCKRTPAGLAALSQNKDSTMGELSPQNRALMESVIAPAHFTTVGGGLHLRDWGQLNRLLDAARSEAQPSGYDGGKSLGERLCEAVAGAGFLVPVAYQNLGAEGQARYERAALTFTASLSDASEVEEEIGHPTPLGALKFRMEQGGHSQTDFAKLIGNRSHASEILAGKRSLSKAMIATLADEWGIPARSLLGPGITASLSDASPKPAEGDA